MTASTQSSKQISKSILFASQCLKLLASRVLIERQSNALVKMLETNTMFFRDSQSMRWAIVVAVGMSVISGSMFPHETSSSRRNRRGRQVSRREVKQLASQMNPTTRWTSQFVDPDSITVVGKDEVQYVSTAFQPCVPDNSNLIQKFVANVGNELQGLSSEELLDALRQSLEVVLPQVDGEEAELRGMRKTLPAGFCWGVNDFSTVWSPSSAPEKIGRNAPFRLSSRRGEEFVDISKDLFSLFEDGDIVHREKQLSFLQAGREISRTGYVSFLMTEAAMEGNSEMAGIADGQFFLSNDNPHFVVGSVHHWKGDVPHQIGGDAYVVLVGVEIHPTTGKIWSMFLAKMTVCAYTQLCGAGHSFAQAALSDKLCLERMQQWFNERIIWKA